MAFKTKELEDYSNQILDRAMGKQQMVESPPLVSKIRQITLRKRLPKLPAKRF
jgi:hypothetical protein